MNEDATQSWKNVQGMDLSKMNEQQQIQLRKDAQKFITISNGSDQAKTFSMADTKAIKEYEERLKKNGQKIVKTRVAQNEKGEWVGLNDKDAQALDA
ncbi:MAG: hypothetical protein J6X03_02390 [Bacilli bacterium]|nr:hypothetical protein [Bacilli bacterium]